MIMAKEKVNYQEVYDLYQLCSETKDLREFCADYGVNYFLWDEGKMNVKYTNDGLHMLGKGYMLWKSIVEPYTENDIVI